MNTQSAKAKGRALQNRVAKDLALRTGLRYGSPNDDLADLRGRLMGTPGADVVRSERAMKAVPFYVECKNAESWSLGSRMFADGLGQLIRWYVSTAEKAAKMEASQNIPIVIAAKARALPIVVLEDQRETLSSRWNMDGLIALRVPLPRFAGSDKWGDLSILSRTVNILAWEDFLNLWYGEKK